MLMLLLLVVAAVGGDRRCLVVAVEEGCWLLLQLAAVAVPIINNTALQHLLICHCHRVPWEFRLVNRKLFSKCRKPSVGRGDWLASEGVVPSRSDGDIFRSEQHATPSLLMQRLH